jgi:hypothetical protein
MKRRLACLTVLLAAGAAAAQAPDEPKPTRLTVRPAAAPSPALKYKLLPELQDQTPGNAALVYYRAFSPELWGNILRPNVWEKVAAAPQAPLAELRRGDLNWVRYGPILRDVDRAARREYVDWEMAERLRREGYFTLMPDVQGLRQIATLLVVRARLEIAAGDSDRAVYTLQTGLTLARHVGRAPTLIQALVGIAVADMMLTQLEELLQQPGAPNLYWALTDLPRPFADLRRALQGDKLSLLGTLPVLRDLETTPLTPQQQQALLAKGFDLLGLYSGKGKSGMDRLEAVGLVLRAYPEAKRALIAEGRRPKEIEALPALQVVLLHSLHQYRRWQDDLYKWYGLPYWQARPHLAEMDRKLRQPGVRLEGMPFVDFLPALDRVVFAAARLDRRLAALRCVEAVRLYAAAHDGKLPAALGDVTDVPIPGDPVTGKPFAYRAAGDRATLSAPIPPGETAQYALTYELTLQH